MTEHVDAATYYDIVEEVGARRLAELDRAVSGDIISEGIVGYSDDIRYLNDGHGPLENTTTYRACVYPEIHAGILHHQNVPKYFQTIVSALTGALVDHANMHHLPAVDQVMRPDESQLQTHLDTIWSGYVGAEPKLREEAIVYRASGYYPVSLQIVRQGGHLALDYVHAQMYARIRM
ncbi:hypothetical protein BH09PAT4_BH09PAT4_07360 [soil metagenome]